MNHTTNAIKTPFKTRRAAYDVVSTGGSTVSDQDIAIFETYDTIYRSLCAALYNYAPGSGHPGGSISSGRFVSTILCPLYPDGAVRTFHGV